jgi:hypothetical protein
MGSRSNSAFCGSSQNSDGREHMEEQPAAGRRGVDRLVEHDEIHAEGRLSVGWPSSTSRRGKEAGDEGHVTSVQT